MSETKTDEELAREWMASAGFGGLWRRNMPLFIMHGGDRIEATVVKGEADCIKGEVPRCVEPGITSFTWEPEQGDWLPDISLPAGRAFLLEDVRKAWGVPAWAMTTNDGSAWWAKVLFADTWHPGYKMFEGATEQAALMAALRAAPGEEARRG